MSCTGLCCNLKFAEKLICCNQGRGHNGSTVPYMASIRNLASHWCGGALVAPQLVVTAAHCVDRKSSGSLRGKNPWVHIGGGPINSIKDIDVRSLSPLLWIGIAHSHAEYWLYIFYIANHLCRFVLILDHLEVGKKNRCKEALTIDIVSRRASSDVEHFRYREHALCYLRIYALKRGDFMYRSVLGLKHSFIQCGQAMFPRVMILP